MGLADVTPGVQETFWAVRKLFDQLAARRPLVVVFDDIHWAEPTFLDLLEYLADSLDGVPALLVCLARPELLEVRGDWMTSKTNASLVTLQPLSDAEMAGLITNLLGGGELADEARARIADAAEGNPLFVEETLADADRRRVCSALTPGPGPRATICRASPFRPRSTPSSPRGSIGSTRRSAP